MNSFLPVSPASNTRSVVKINQPLLLISEVQRSGGTLLSQLFDGHPQCFAHPHEISWGRPKKWHWPNLDLSALSASELFSALDEPWLEDYAARGYYKKNPKTNVETYPFQFDREQQRAIFSECLAHCNPFSQRDVLDAYNTSFFNAWSDYQDLHQPHKKFVTGFTPRVVMHSDSMNRFFRDYPDGFMFSSIRHPASWYSSVIQHGYQKHGGIPEIMAFWMESTLATLAMSAQYPEQVYPLLFEDLILDTDRIMAEICHFTGLEFSEALLKPTFNGKPIQSNSHYDAVYHVDTAVVERYKATLSADEIEQIESLTFSVYQQAQQFIRDRHGLSFSQTPTPV
ncbi:sulfotransferase [Vampirovibrio sp.]|uniref:sulfotransferase n=1 Tax=Vampirovibrio sp. TaxID=2717857 RepID=UPI0035934606